MHRTHINTETRNETSCFVLLLIVCCQPPPCPPSALVWSQGIGITYLWYKILTVEGYDWWDGPLAGHPTMSGGQSLDARVTCRRSLLMELTYA